LIVTTSSEERGSGNRRGKGRSLSEGVGRREEEEIKKKDANDFRIFNKFRARRKACLISYLLHAISAGRGETISNLTPDVNCK
jgi:hypothetical protein